MGGGERVGGRGSAEDNALFSLHVSSLSSVAKKLIKGRNGFCPLLIS